MVQTAILRAEMQLRNEKDEVLVRAPVNVRRSGNGYQILSETTLTLLADANEVHAFMVVEEETFQLHSLSRTSPKAGVTLRISATQGEHIVMGQRV